MRPFAIDRQLAFGLMRIASLVPSTTEMVAAMGLGHRLVTRTHECDSPESVADIEAVTRDLLPGDLGPAEIDAAVTASLVDSHTIYALDADALRRSEPDVVLTQATCAVCAVDLDTVESAVCTMPKTAKIVSFDPMTIDDVVDGAAVIGEAVGGHREGLALQSHLTARLDWLERRVAGLDRPRVAAVEWPDPIYAPGHWVPDIIEAAGGTSVFGQPGGRSERSDLDALEATDPDIVLLSFCGYNLETTIAHAGNLLALVASSEMPSRPELFAMDGSGYTSRPGPRLVDAVEALAWALHRPHPDVRPAPGIIARYADGEWVDEAAT